MQYALPIPHKSPHEAEDLLNVDKKSTSAERLDLSCCRAVGALTQLILLCSALLPGIAQRQEGKDCWSNYFLEILQNG